MRSLLLSIVCILTSFVGNSQTFDSNSMYFLQGDVIARYLSFTVIEDGIFETLTIMPDTAMLNSDPAKRCDHMKEAYNPQGFKV